jgi:hypothetical protein
MFRANNSAPPSRRRFRRSKIQLVPNAPDDRPIAKSARITPLY